MQLMIYFWPCLLVVFVEVTLSSKSDKKQEFVIKHRLKRNSEVKHQEPKGNENEGLLPKSGISNVTIRHSKHSNPILKPRKQRRIRKPKRITTTLMPIKTIDDSESHNDNKNEETDHTNFTHPDYETAYTNKTISTEEENKLDKKLTEILDHKNKQILDNQENDTVFQNKNDDSPDDEINVMSLVYSTPTLLSNSSSMSTSHEKNIVVEDQESEIPGENLTENTTTLPTDDKANHDINSSKINNMMAYLNHVYGDTKSPSKLRNRWKNSKRPKSNSNRRSVIEKNRKTKHSNNANKHPKLNGNRFSLRYR